MSESLFQLSISYHKTNNTVKRLFQTIFSRVYWPIWISYKTQSKASKQAKQARHNPPRFVLSAYCLPFVIPWVRLSYSIRMTAWPRLRLVPIAAPRGTPKPHARPHLHRGKGGLSALGVAILYYYIRSGRLHKIFCIRSRRWVKIFEGLCHQ